MSYLVFARKYRPQNFDSVVGQEPIIHTLQNAVKDNRVAHAYIFTGPRGVGKTTLARILAKTLNCAQPYPAAPCNACDSCAEITAGTSMDVIEIDGASNRGIDHIRDLREHVKYAPSKGRYKVYIIDEVHMLTTEAFNALLKTIEEPPPHAKFFLATTEIHDVPATILSRCQRFDFRLLSPVQIVDQLESIARQEGLAVDRDSLMILARYSGGSMRDALSFFDQLIAYAGGQTAGPQTVRRFLGVVSNESLFELIDAAAASDLARGLAAVNTIIENGHNVIQVIDDLIHLVRAMLLCKTGAQASILDYAAGEIQLLGEKSALFSLEQILYMITILLRDRKAVKETLSERIFLEVLFVKLAKTRDLVEIGQLLASDTAAPPAPTARASEKPAQPPHPPATPRPVHKPAPPLPSVAAAPQQPTAPSAPPSTPRPAAAPAAPSPRADGKPGAWENLLEALRTAAPLVHTYLSGGVPAPVENDTLTVAFPEHFSFYVEHLQDRKNIALIEAAMQQTGFPARRVQWTIASDPTPPGAVPHAAAAKTFQDPEVQDVLQHKHVRKLLDELSGGGKVVKIIQQPGDAQP